MPALMDSVHIVMKDCGKTPFFFLKKTCMALGNSARKSADFAVRKYDEMCPAVVLQHYLFVVQKRWPNYNQYLIYLDS